MKKRILIAAAVLCAFAKAQVPVSPIVQPHMTFVNAAGLACAGCSLHSYAAGTTTPQPTYTDASGTSQNTNPVILGTDGGGNIWLGSNSYKLVLVDTFGSTIWSVDQVNAGSLFPCSTVGAIQIANSSDTGLTCDPNITINTTTHVINVGTLGANYVTIGSLGTPTRWTFDTTTPATALASLGGVTVNPGTTNQIAVYTGSSAIGGTTALPSGTTATTQSPGDNSVKVASTAYVALPGAINPTSIQLATGVAMTANQGNGVKIQHSTGTTTTGDGAKFDANGNVIDAGATVQNVATGHVIGTVYQNTDATPRLVMVAGVVSGVGCTLNPLTDSSPTPTTALPITSATPGSGTASISTTFMVLPGNYYEVTTDHCTDAGWAEWTNF